jgi:hypothetical protein
MQLALITGKSLQQQGIYWNLKKRYHKEHYRRKDFHSKFRGIFHFLFLVSDENLVREEYQTYYKEEEKSNRT